jgi:hypothetical protein
MYEPLAKVNQHPWRMHHNGWMDGWMDVDRTLFFSFGSCSQVNFPIVEDSQIGVHPTG